MASATGALSGAAAGAAVGSVVPVYGTAIGAVLGGVLGAFGTSEGGDNGQAQLSANALQQQQNSLSYQQALTALAMRRGAAGFSDDQGSNYGYDPSTNQWTSTLGKLPGDVQRSSQQASIERNTTDARQQQRVNADTVMRAATASRDAEGAGAALRNANPVSPEALTGQMQDASSRAFAESQRPIIQQTLQQYARAGTGGGAVISQMARDSADKLNESMTNNVLAGYKNAAGISNDRMQGAATKYGAFAGQANPTLGQTQLSTMSPQDNILAMLAKQQQGASTPASSGAMATGYGMSANNTAAKLGVDSYHNPNAAMLGNMSGLGDLVKSYKGDIQGLLGMNTNTSISNVQGLMPMGNQPTIWNTNNPIGTDTLTNGSWLTNRTTSGNNT